jgi:hypothetical protein
MPGQPGLRSRKPIAQAWSITSGSALGRGIRRGFGAVSGSGGAGCRSIETWGADDSCRAACRYRVSGRPRLTSQLGRRTSGVRVCGYYRCLLLDGAVRAGRRSFLTRTDLADVTTFDRCGILSASSCRARDGQSAAVAPKVAAEQQARNEVDGNRSVGFPFHCALGAGADQDPGRR